MIHILAWTTKKLKKTLSRPLHSNLKKIQGLFKDLRRNSRTFQGKMEFEGFSRTSPKIQGFFKTVRALYYCDFEFMGSTLQYLNKWVTGHNELLLIYIQSNLSLWTPL